PPRRSSDLQFVLQHRPITTPAKRVCGTARRGPRASRTGPAMRPLSTRIWAVPADAHETAGGRAPEVAVNWPNPGRFPLRRSKLLPHRERIAQYPELVYRVQARPKPYSMKGRQP